MGTCGRLAALAGALAAVRLAGPRVTRLAIRTGVTDAEVARPLPGDDVVPDANHVLDRAATIPAPVNKLWPWLVQLGKRRGGWYFPRWVELGIPPSRRGLRTIDSKFLRLTVGERVPDWGPGEFEVALIEPERALVYRSLRQKSNNRQWPTVEDPMPDDVLIFSWALVLDSVDDSHSRLHLRLRLRTAREQPVLTFLGGLIDWVTVALLFAGLRGRLRT